MLTFRVNIPGFGNIYVQAADQNAAIAAAQQYLQSNGIAVEQGAGTPTATATSAGSKPPDALTLTPNGQGGYNATGGPSSSGNQLPQENTPPATPTGTPVDQPTSVSSPFKPTGEEVAPFGQFRNFLRSQGLDPDSIIGGTVQDQFQPFLSTFGLNQVLHNLGATAAEDGGSLADQIQTLGSPQSFLQFLQQQGPTGIANTALGALQGIAGQPLGQENTFLAALQGRDAAPGTDLGNILQGTARQALRTKLSPAVLGLFGNAAFNLSNRRFEDSLAGAADTGGTPPTFAQHLLRTLGLG